MAIKQDASSGSIGGRNNTKLTKEQQDEEAKKQQVILDTNNDAAIKFNNYVRAVYFGGRIPTSQTNSVTKYYQDRLTTKKGTDPATQASEFIPANLRFYPFSVIFKIVFVYSIPQKPFHCF